MKQNNMVSYKVRTLDGTLCCRLGMDRNFRLETEVFCSYARETIAYTVCRYIRHCAQLRDPLVREAVRLGLDPCGKKKRRQHTVHTSAQILELPGGDAWLKLVVKQGEILITGLEIRNRE